MSIYNDTLSAFLGIRNIYEVNPNFDPNDFSSSNPFNDDLTGPNESNSFFGKQHTEETKKLYSIQRQGKNNPMYGRSTISEQKLRWYNNGTENIYVTEGTEPKGFIPGRIGLKRKPHSKEHREKLRKANTGKPAANRLTVVSPEGTRYSSIKEAAAACNLTVSAFRYRKVENGDWSIVR